jgi:hypothetical protein
LEVKTVDDREIISIPISIVAAMRIIVALTLALCQAPPEEA